MRPTPALAKHGDDGQAVTVLGVRAGFAGPELLAVNPRIPGFEDQLPVIGQGRPDVTVHDPQPDSLIGVRS